MSMFEAWNVRFYPRVLTAQEILELYEAEAEMPKRNRRQRFCSWLRTT